MAENISIEIPASIDGLSLPDPGLLQYYANAEDRNYWIDFEIDDRLLIIAREIIKYNQIDKDIPVEDRKPIVLWIFSEGGLMDVCYSFLDVCALSKTPIITINVGIAMSAALLILLAGHKRYALSMSDALMHSGSGGAVGTYEQAEATMDNYKKNIEKMRKYILNRTGMDPKTYNRKKNKEWYLDAAEQVEYGVVHGILNSLDEIL